MVRAKFEVTGKEPFVNHDGESGENITMFPVYKLDDEGNNLENENFGKWTPSGQVNMTIMNPAAFEYFEVGKQYYLDFTKAE